MSFSQIKGNEQVTKALVGMVDSGKVPHAIMFCEDDGGGAIRIVQAFLEYLFCKNRGSGDSCRECPSCHKISRMIHPDVHYVFPVNSGCSRDYIDVWRKLVLENPCFGEDSLTEALETGGKSSIIAVAESKALIDTLALSALEGGYRAVVIYLPEKMNREAANRLLKVIEEPPALTQFVFITHALENVLPTIASRCQRIRVAPVAEAAIADESEADYRNRELFSALMQSLLGRDLLASLEVGDAISSLGSREQMKRFCRFAARQLRPLFLIQQGLGDMAGRDKELEMRPWVQGCKKTFARNALQAISRANTLVDRNVNPKIIFTDLVNRLYFIV